MTDAEFVREIAQPLSGRADDYDPLLQFIGDARVILLGEATHGTDEFYSERATITKRLIAEKGFSIVAIEADWPDSARVHRYVRGATGDASAEQALSGFRRFPTWMWRNTVVMEFVGWLRDFNKNIGPKRAPIGFYGMDLYSLHASIEAVLAYLEKVDRNAARRARLRYSCFDHFSRNPQEYGYATTVGAMEPCENAVVAQLVELQQKASEFLSRDGRWPRRNSFSQSKTRG
jgi:erythromycin esterase-like protein